MRKPGEGSSDTLGLLGGCLIGAQSQHCRARPPQTAATSGSAVQ